MAFTTLKNFFNEKLNYSPKKYANVKSRQRMVIRHETSSHFKPLNEILNRKNNLEISKLLICEIDY